MRGILKPTTFQTVLLHPVTRCLSTSHCRLVAAEKGLLSKLRKQTGIPFINCKKALEKFDNDFDQAKKWLQEQAQKEGWARATKLQTRPMAQGLIAVMGDQKQATLLEVNCETDFVARNDKFLSMVTKLVQECNRSLGTQADKRVSLNREELEKMVTSEQSTMADIVALTVGNLGENMALRRADFIRAAKDSVLCSYVHPSSSSKKNQSLQLGKYGAVVEVRQVNGRSPLDTVLNVKDLGSHLCQHIVGMNPKSVGEFTPGSMKDSLSKDNDTHSDDLGAGTESNPTQTEQEVEEDALLSQEFLLDTSMTVGELVYLNGAEVKDFVRFACGEELESDK